MPEKKNSAVVILMTAPDGAVAESIGRTLVEERLVACVNIVPGLRSIYRWEGELQVDAEALMLAKARLADVDLIVTRVAELHPYDVPEVLATEVVAGLGDYLDWVKDETERGR
ncbi:MAG TPA: divalent-cation tolerance protein CutA [Gemmatimonadota bacterium]|nr:divalent-cation tolerance protein CutA [Gemmatimonadota bacterium]